MTSDTKIRDEVLAELLAGYEKPDDLLGEDGILERLTKALVERALGAELSHHLSYEKGSGRTQKRENQRNGYSQKRVITENGTLDIDMPRDRAGTLEPQIVPKGERRLSGFDERITAMLRSGYGSVRDPGVCGRAVWSNGVIGAIHDGDGCGIGRDEGVAESTPGTALSGGDLRRPARQDSG